MANQPWTWHTLFNSLECNQVIQEDQLKWWPAKVWTPSLLTEHNTNILGKTVKTNCLKKSSTSCPVMQGVWSGEVEVVSWVYSEGLRNCPFSRETMEYLYIGVPRVLTAVDAPRVLKIGCASWKYMRCAKHCYGVSTGSDVESKALSNVAVQFLQKTSFICYKRSGNHQQWFGQSWSSFHKFWE